MVFFAEFDS